MTSFVEISDMSLRYGNQNTGFVALKDVEMNINDGEFVAVVGPSGCGKSTLLKAVTGLWPICDGSLKVDGEFVTGPLKITGMAFQNATLLPWRNVLNNVLLPLEIVEPYAANFRSKRKEYEEKAIELLRIVGLEGFETNNVWELSGGMQQRVQLCRALIHEPKLLMLDEPFGALDAFTREGLWDILQDLWIERKPTIMLITHDLREAVYLADRVAVMSTTPGHILSETVIPQPRPRNLECTYEPDFTRIVHELRSQIDQARGLKAKSSAAAA